MPDPDLQATALRYAAGDLTPDEAAGFEARLAEEQGARDALAEAVRLSAQAIGQAPPAPHPSFRALLRARLSLRAYGGSPLAWTGLGGAAVAACALLGLALAGQDGPRPAHDPAAAPALVHSAPRAEPHEQAAEPAPDEYPVAAAADPHSVAETWADLSDHQGVEKARADERRMRHRVRDLGHPHVWAAVKTSANDVRHP
jgi:hypothetical protein